MKDYPEYRISDENRIERKLQINAVITDITI